MHFLSGNGKCFALSLLANAPNGNDEIVYMDYVGKVTALGGEKYTATITEIGNTDTNNSGNNKYIVALTMDCAETMLSCMNATATIVLVSSMSGFGGGRIPMT